MIPENYIPGFTHRIKVTCVRDDCFATDGSGPEKFYQYWQEVIATQADYEDEKESVCVAMMDTRLNIFAWHRVSLGSVAESSAMPREIFRPVIAAAAYSFVLMHNHPSGDPSPSRADENITRRMVEAAGILQIEMKDHVIIGRPAPGRAAYYSFREAGVVP